MSPTDPRLRSAIEEAEGWAAGLVLTALALTPSDGSPDVALSPRHDQNVAEFVGEAILASCTADVQGFLEATCFLPVLEPDLCDELTGRTDSLAVLRDLARRNCLTVELAADRPSFRYHPLLRRALRRRLDEQDAVRRVTLTRDAALRLAKRDRIIEATNLLAASEDAELLEGFVRRACGPAMVRGYVITVLRWISALPPQRVEAAPDLLLLLARASGLRGERLKAEAAVRQARRRVDRADTTPDPGLGTALLFFEMSVKAWHGEIADVIPLLHQLASPGAHPAESPTLSMLGLSREAMLPNLSMGLLLQGHLDDCLGVTDEVITLADLTPLTRSAVLGIGVRALALAWSGRDSEAAHLVRHAVTPIAAWRGSDPDPLAFWCAAAWIGPSADANASLARARDLASRTIIPIVRVLPEVVAIRVHIRLGQFDVVEDALRNASAAIAELPEQGFLTNLLRRLELDARRTVGTRPDLTTQEIRTLHAVATGMTRREVADHLHYSVNTVKTHLRSAYLKLGVADRHDAITRARAWGMLPPTAGAGSDTA